MAFIAGTSEERARLPRLNASRDLVNALPSYGDLITGKVPGRENDQQITFYQNSGMQACNSRQSADMSTVRREKPVWGERFRRNGQDIRDRLQDKLEFRRSGKARNCSCLRNSDCSYGARPFRRNGRNRRFRPFSDIGSPGGTRTPDPAVNSRLLYQLSYRGSARREGYNTPGPRIPAKRERSSQDPVPAWPVTPASGAMCSTANSTSAGASTGSTA